MKRFFSALFVASLLSIFGFAGSASAHDQVVDTYPLDGKVVAAGQFDVTVSFSEKILNSDQNKGLTIVVSGPLGKNAQQQSVNCVHRTDKSISTPVNLDKKGVYEVRWRSVSSDGHPTEGSFLFQLTNEKGYVAKGLPQVDQQCVARKPAAEPSLQPSTSPSKAPVAKPTVSAAGVPSKQDVINQSLPGLIVAIVLVVAGSVAGVVRSERKRAGASGKDSRYE